MSWKAQSAIEYLMTYGWMLLVVAIAGGAIFSITEDQGIESFQGFEGDRLGIIEYGLTSEGLSMFLESQTQEKIAVTEIKIEDDEREIKIPVDFELALDKGKVVNLPHFSRSSGREEINIDFMYNTGSLENISSAGVINGNLMLDNRLSLYLPLSKAQKNNASVKDISSNSNDGTIRGNVTEEVGISQGAVGFDGSNSQIDIADNGDLANVWNRPELSISFWIKTNDLNDMQWSDLIRINAGNGSFRIENNANNRDALSAYWTAEGAEGNNPSYHMGFIPDVNNNKFQHVVWTYDGQTAKSWTNGELVDSRSVNSDDLEIVDGAAVTLRGDVFSWHLDEFRIYNDVLSEEEIVSIYKSRGLVN